MSAYLKNVVREFDFEGDHVVVELRALTLEDSLRYEEAPDLPKDASEGEKRAALFAELKVHREVLPQYVARFEGLTDADGQPLTLADVIDAAYFMGLVKTLGDLLVARSFPPSKLGGQSRSNSTAESGSAPSGSTSAA